MICPNCGGNCPEHFKFCGECGASLHTEACAEAAPAEEVCVENAPAAEETVCAENAAAEETCAESAAAEETCAESASGAGRLWPPVAIMGGLTALGLLLFYLIR